MRAAHERDDRRDGCARGSPRSTARRRARSRRSDTPRRTTTSRRSGRRVAMLPVRLRRCASSRNASLRSSACSACLRSSTCSCRLAVAARFLSVRTEVVAIASRLTAQRASAPFEYMHVVRQHEAGERQEHATPRGRDRRRAVAGRSDQQHHHDIKHGDRDVERRQRVDQEHHERDDGGKRPRDAGVATCRARSARAIACHRLSRAVIGNGRKRMARDEHRRSKVAFVDEYRTPAS